MGSEWPRLSQGVGEKCSHAEPLLGGSSSSGHARGGLPNEVQEEEKKDSIGGEELKVITLRVIDLIDGRDGGQESKLDFSFRTMSSNIIIQD